MGDIYLTRACCALVGQPVDPQKIRGKFWDYQNEAKTFFLFADLAFSLKMISNELLLTYSFYVRSRELTNRGLLDMAHLPLSLHCGFILGKSTPRRSVTPGRRLPSRSGPHYSCDPHVAAGHQVHDGDGSGTLSHQVHDGDGSGTLSRCHTRPYRC